MQVRKVACIAALLGLLGIGAVGTAAPSSADSGDGTACVSGRWPADVQGQPANLKPLGPTGVYVWHTDDGWHLRVTHSTRSHVTFTGRITTDGSLYGVTRRTEDNDRVRFSESASGVAFRFENYGGIDGIDFKTRCANRLTITGQLNGRTLRPTEVFIGANAHHPGGVPFVIRRR